MFYVDKFADEVFDRFFQDTGGQDWSEAGEYSYARSTWRGLVVFKQELPDGSFNVGGDGSEGLAEVWSEFIKYLNESEDQDE